MEWTNQHACGGDDTTYCSMVLQYACEDSVPGVRDGYPTGDLVDADNNNNNNPPYQRASFDDNNNDGTNQIQDTDAKRDNVEYGMHETVNYYRTCRKTIRNKGLYTADRQIGDNKGALRTRQNPNGNEHGFECAEERDYYPWWNPSPWKDIAVMTTDTNWCDYYQSESQNVKSRWYCEPANDLEDINDSQIHIEEQKCTEGGFGQWVEKESWGISAPDCMEHAHTRQNHLGNVVEVTTEDSGPANAHYDWTIPEMKTDANEVSGTEDEALCVFRIRYNISTDDYGDDGWGSYDGIGANSAPFDSRYNCPRVTEAQGATTADDNMAGAATGGNDCKGRLDDGNFRPRYNRPYVDIFGDGPASTVSIALNTDQSGRTFQDRSHVFQISKRPKGVSGTIWNLNSRGRRGNIVQAYPAVEYDFVPQDLNVDQGDYVHFQWTGSDFNTQRNPNNAEGWQYSDRHNIMEVNNLNQQFPVVPDRMTFFTEDEAKTFALQDSEANLVARGAQCEEFSSGQANENNSPTNCAKLNFASSHFNPAPMKINQASGSYNFVNTRDNNFSNRAGKFRITISGESAAAKAAKASGIAFGSIIGVIVVGVFCFWAWAAFTGQMKMFNSTMSDAGSIITCGWICCGGGGPKSTYQKDIAYQKQADGPL